MASDGDTGISAIVIDAGSGFCKVGNAGDSTPVVVYAEFLLILKNCLDNELLFLNILISLSHSFLVCAVFE